MKAIEYVTTVSEDGRFSLPPDLLHELDLRGDDKVRVLLLVEETKPADASPLSRFAGRWQDERDADEIIAEIYADRAKNIRTDGKAYELPD